MIKNEEKVVLGACISQDNDAMQIDKRVYLGIELSLNDILDNAVNACVLGVTDVKAFERDYKELNAVGIVLFPQINDYVFLNDGDVVLPWSGNERDSVLLDRYLADYRNCAVFYAYAEVYEEKLDSGDHLVRLNNCIRTRKWKGR